MPQILSGGVDCSTQQDLEPLAMYEMRGILGFLLYMEKSCWH